VKAWGAAEVDVCIVEHLDGGYALALRDSLNPTDVWCCVCPLEIILNGDS